MALTCKEDFSDIFNELYQLVGIDKLESRVMVINALVKLSNEYGISQSSAFIEALHVDKTFYQDVVNAITVNETFFMREIETLEYLIEYIVKSSLPLRILSMPCSNAAEVYSILILLHKKSPALLDKITIIGADINSEALELAHKGIYSKRALHKMSEEDITRYFTPIDSEYKISSILQTHATFIQKNIFDLSEKETPFDVVLSRNLFIYFNTQTRTRALTQLSKILKKEALLLLGHADFIEPAPTFKQLDNTIYKKL